VVEIEKDQTIRSCQIEEGTGTLIILLKYQFMRNWDKAHPRKVGFNERERAGVQKSFRHIFDNADSVS